MDEEVKRLPRPQDQHWKQKLKWERLLALGIGLREDLIDIEVGDHGAETRQAESSTQAQTREASSSQVREV